MSPRSRDPKPRPDEVLPLLLRPAGIVDPLPLDRAFARPAPIEVDVGCGKGRFLLARARAFPDVNFLGIDRMAERLRKIDRRAVREGIANVRLLHIEAAYAIRHLLAPASVQTFYIFFPDPWPKRRHRERRLMSEAVLADLARALVPAGRLHFATDHADYFAEAAKRLRASAWFAAIEPFVPNDEERTDFERLFTGQGLTIGRCSFEKRAEPPPMPRHASWKEPLSAPRAQ